MASKAEIQKLKTDWLRDPCWDLETTEGFGEHVGELFAYRLMVERQNERRRENELRERALMLGIPGNLELAAHLERLEERVRELEEGE